MRASSIFYGWLCYCGPKGSLPPVGGDDGPEVGPDVGPEVGVPVDPKPDDDPNPDEEPNPDDDPNAPELPVVGLVEVPVGGVPPPARPAIAWA